MKLKFNVEVQCKAMNEMSLYERLRDAVFNWQTQEPNVKSVSVLPSRREHKESPSNEPKETFHSRVGFDESKKIKEPPRDAVDLLRLYPPFHNGTEKDTINWEAEVYDLLAEQPSPNAPPAEQCTCDLMDGDKKCKYCLERMDSEKI